MNSKKVSKTKELIDKAKKSESKENIQSKIEDLLKLSCHHLDYSSSTINEILDHEDARIRVITFKNFVRWFEIDSDEKQSIINDFLDLFKTVQSDYSFSVKSPPKTSILIKEVVPFPSRMSSLIGLPKGDYNTNKSGFLTYKERAYLVNIGKDYFFPWLAEGEWFETEDEIRLVGALYLSCKRGWYSIYPGQNFYFQYEILPADYNLSFKKLNEGNIKELKKVIDFLSKINILPRSPHQSFKEKLDFDNRIDIDFFKKLINEMNSDSALIQTLYHFCKANVFKNHIGLQEESASLVAFSLDGVIALLVEKYGYNQTKEFIKELPSEFDTPEGYPYLLDLLYRRRTFHVHPKNKDFEESPYPNWESDDVLEGLQVTKNLLYIYILGELPDWLPF